VTRVAPRPEAATAPTPDLRVIEENTKNLYAYLRSLHNDITPMAQQLADGRQLWHILWLIGTGIFITIFLVEYIKSYRSMREALPIQENKFIAAWLHKQDTKRMVQVLTSDRISTPITIGIVHPKIILPESMNCGEHQQLSYVLTHEMIHIKRFDNLWKLISALALCVHWFNPLVWVMYILFNRDIEISCDERVISMYGENSKSAYALCLIHLAEQKNAFSQLCSSFGKNATEERIVSIMKFKKTSMLAILVALILIAGAIMMFATSAITDIEPKGSLDKQTQITPEVLEQFNNLGLQYNLRFAPQYSVNGEFASWDEVLLYLYKSGYSGGGAMSAGEVEKNVYKTFGGKATFNHQSTDHFIFDGKDYIPKGIMYSGESAFQVVSLHLNPETSLYEAKLLQFDYDTTVANADNPNATANANVLGNNGVENKKRISGLIQSQKTDDLIPSRAIEISFSIDASSDQVIFDSISFDDDIKNVSASTAAADVIIPSDMIDLLSITYPNFDDLSYGTDITCRLRTNYGVKSYMVAEETSDDLVTHN